MRTRQTLAERAKLARLRAGFEKESDAAKVIGCSRPLVISWENGSAETIGGKFLLAAAKAYKVDPDWLAMGTPHDGYPWTPSTDPGWREIEASTQGAAAGGGRVPDDYAETHRLKFRQSSLMKKGLNPDNLRVEYVRGDSMQPRLHDGDAVLVDTSDTQKINDGAIYWIRYEGENYVKQIHKSGSSYVIESMNKLDPQWRRPVVVAAGEEFNILGRVRWIGSWEG